MQTLVNPRHTIRGVTRTIFARLCKQALRIGIHIPGPVGDAVKDGIKLHWNYDPITEQLDVECVGAPFWIDPTRLQENLRSEVEALLEQSRTQTPASRRPQADRTMTIPILILPREVSPAASAPPDPSTPPR